MKISKVKINNFRTIQEAEIEFDSITTFIGPNGVGKSTVLRALNWFFNGDIKNGELKDDDVYSGAPTEDIRVGVTFSDLTENDKHALGKYSPKESNFVTIWKIREFETGNEYLSANYLGYPDFSDLRRANNATEIKEKYAALRGNDNPLALPDAKTRASIEEAITVWESNNVEKLVEIPESTSTQLFGFNGKSKLGGIFDYVFIDSNLRAGDESEDSKGSILAKILDFYIDRKESASAIQDITSRTIQSHQKEIFDKFSNDLETINSNLNRVVINYSSGRQVQVAPTPLEVKTAGASFTINISDGETITSVDKQGHGFQRTLIISALQTLADLAATQSSRVIFLAIEEPELYQHPIQARNFAKVLQELSEDPSNGVQIAYATHSPYFIDDKDFHQVRRISRKNNKLGPNVSISSATKQRIIEKLDGILSEGSINSQLGKVITGQIAEAIFSNAVLIVEGSTEVGIFYGIGDRVHKGYLESLGISVIAAGGKMNIPLLHAILDELGVPSYCLFDADAGCEERGIKSGKEVKKIRDEKKNNISQNRKILKYFGELESDFPDQKISDKYANFKDHLETFLVEEWPEWKSSCEKLEDDMGVSVSKNSDIYRQVTLDSSLVVPKFLDDILENVKRLV